MTFLVFYDRRGQPQRTATSSNEADTQRYLDAGFVIVTEGEYQRVTALVPSATIDELPSLIAATALLTQIQNQQRQIAQLPNVDTEALDRLQARIKAEYQRITQQFTEGKITIDQWYRQMVDLSNRANLAATALAVGGTRNLSSDDIQAVERANETQASYLNGFRRVLVGMSAAGAIARAALYGGAITALFYTAIVRAMGLPPMPAMPGILTSCLTNCGCGWRIVQLAGDGNWDCYWEVSPIEHCPECIRRRDEFNPLQIRGGVIQPFNPVGLYTI